MFREPETKIAQERRTRVPVRLEGNLWTAGALSNTPCDFQAWVIHGDRAVHCIRVFEGGSDLIGNFSRVRLQLWEKAVNVFHIDLDGSVLVDVEGDIFRSTNNLNSW